MLHVLIMVYSQCCREQFVALHEEPILEDLADYWERKFGALEYVIAIHSWKTVYIIVMCI